MHVGSHGSPADRASPGLYAPFVRVAALVVLALCRDVEEAPHASLPDDLDVLALNLSGVAIGYTVGGSHNQSGRGPCAW